MASLHPTPTRTPWSRAAILLGLPSAVIAAWVLSALIYADLDDPLMVIWPISSTVTTAVGALILWRRPGHRMGRLLVSVGLMFGASVAVSLLTRSWTRTASASRG